MGMFTELHKQDLADKAKQTQQVVPKTSNKTLLQTNNKTSLQVSKEAIKQAVPDVVVNAAPEEQSRFTIAEEPYTQATFKFTDGELDALDDLKRDLKRQNNLKTTKQNLIRYALHRLVEEYIREGENSWLVAALQEQ